MMSKADLVVDLSSEGGFFQKCHLGPNSKVRYVLEIMFDLIGMPKKTEQSLREMVSRTSAVVGKLNDFFTLAVRSLKLQQLPATRSISTSNHSEIAQWLGQLQPSLNGVLCASTVCNSSFPLGVKCTSLASRDKQNIAQPQSCNSSYSISLEGIYKCPDCSAAYRCEQSLQRHWSRAHAEKVHSCDLCDFKCVRLTSLYNHKAEVHERRHVCHVCHKPFCSPSLLKKHSLTHEKEKPFFCAKCCRKFKSQESLNEHQQYVHSKDKAAVCVYCRATFQNILQLKRHLTFHEDEKLASSSTRCSLCERLFENVGTLNHHLSSAHKLRGHRYEKRQQEKLRRINIAPTSARA